MIQFLSLSFFFFKQKTAYEIMPSLVGSEMCIRDRINITSVSQNPFGFSSGTQEGLGSGFIITSHGYILTNNHVVEGATKITVMLKDGREFRGQVVGTDSTSDIAVVKISGCLLYTVELGDSSALTVGQKVIAIGNPY